MLTASSPVGAGHLVNDGNAALNVYIMSLYYIGYLTSAFLLMWTVAS